MQMVEAGRWREEHSEGRTPLGDDKGLGAGLRDQSEVNQKMDTVDTGMQGGTTRAGRDLGSRSRTAREGITDTSGGIRQVGGISM